MHYSPRYIAREKSGSQFYIVSIILLIINHTYTHIYTYTHTLHIHTPTYTLTHIQFSHDCNILRKSLHCTYNEKESQMLLHVYKNIRYHTNHCNAIMHQSTPGVCHEYHYEHHSTRHIHGMTRIWKTGS